ncbi:MAG: RNA-directed DNA polymerase [Kiritimatiellia bacterium]|jgi:RNA-directed DNA polymerase
MNKLEALREITTKHQLAVLLGVKATTLTYVLYVLNPSTQYTSFTIPKKSGGDRTILAPSNLLKFIQSSLSNLLQDCIDEINKAKYVDGRFTSKLSHGFVRNRSIMTNAMMHLNQKNVLNIDLKDFFDSFNFGRVRGFFIANNHFKLNSHIATVIAQIACYDNKLPQGSPCSPVITNLITHSLDIRLASLAKQHSCTYSRYADDITFSSREATFPKKIMLETIDEYIAGKKLKSEIRRAGFEMNQEKTRIQYKDSRQDVTGLVVNKKPNVKKEYWRTVKAQCHYLFHTGEFLDGDEEGNIDMLEGRLNFIDQIDRYNRQRQQAPLNPLYKLDSHGINTIAVLSGREKTFRRFLYYRLFYGNTKPTILCEGKTDNVYLKSAISKLVSAYPKLATPKVNDTPHRLLVRFLNYTERTRFLLQLYGGTSYLNYFISSYYKHYKFYKAPKPKHPVLIVLDNDSGFKGKKDSGIDGKLKKIDSAKAYPATLSKHDFRGADFIHVIHNLYIVLTPLGDKGQETAIEDLFDAVTRQIQVSGKSFNPKEDKDNEKEYGKEVFANKVINAQKSTINFDGLKPLLDRIVKAIEHYDAIK